MNKVVVTVPGKIMLAGEYAVLQGGAALASTIDAYLTVSASTVSEKKDCDGFVVASDLWPEQMFIAADAAAPVLNNPLLETVQFGMKQFGVVSGEIKVTSKLAVNFGVGSSSALRLGVLFALHALGTQHQAPDQERRWELARHGFKLQRQQQSFASGYDFATQLLGGTVLLRSHSSSTDDWPGMVGRFSSLQPGLQTLVHPYVGGSGAPTKSVTLETMAWLTSKGHWPALNALSEELVEAFVAAIGDPENQAATQTLIQLCGAHGRLFAGSPHEPRQLLQLLQQLPGYNATWTFKTTGAGGEDAVLLVGHERDLSAPREALPRAGWKKLPHGFSNNAVQVEKEMLH